VSPPRLKTRLPLLAIAVSAIVLVVAGVFLYRWVNRLSDLDLRRQQEDLDASMINLQREFAAALHEAVWFFHPIPETRSGTPEAVYSELYSQWKSTARWPELIDEVRIAFRSRNGGVILAQLQPQSGRLKEQPWPASLEAFRDSLRAPVPVRALAKGTPHDFTSHPALQGGFMRNGTLTLALPILSFRPMPTGTRFLFQSAGPHGPAAPRPDAPAPPGPEGPGAELFPKQRFIYATERLANSRLAGWCFLKFNLRFIQGQLLPFLVDQYFGASGLAKYHVAVVTGRPARIIFASDASVSLETVSSFDARITLFSPHLRFGAVEAIRAQILARRAAAGTDVRRWEAPPPMILERLAERVPHSPDAWQMVARDRRGSLAGDVASMRRRNLAIGFGTLLLLACSIGAIVVGTYRAHALATRQMEFVAGISHELRTPLAVIESAAFNLASGRVDDPGRIHQYGEVIQTEGRRLSDLVEQTLAYSGVQAGGQRYEFKPVRILDVINEALTEYDPLFSKMGWRVEKLIETSLPPVSADPRVLKSVIKNVIGNALKYAPEGKWLRVTARAVESWRGTEVQVAIADHGPGIDPSDLPHIFEPFYRGHQVVASPVPGAGLGLSLVNRHMQAHSGSVSVRTTNGSGTEFALHLPSL
jgi:signal transduction histidine kinase